MLAKRTLSRTNSAPLLLWTTMSKNISKTGGSHDEEDACSTPYHNFSPSPQYRPVLGVRHSTHATSAENVRSATPPPASESFVPQASPVQDPSLSRILDMPQSENAALRAQIADLTKQLTLFLSRENQRTKPAQPKSSAQVPAASPGPSTETPQPSATEAAPPVHNAAPETEAPNKRPRVSYAEKLKSSFPNASTEKLLSATSRTPGLTTHRKKLPTADRLQLVYVGSILRKPIREAKQNLMTWALTHALAQSLTSSSLAPPPVSFSCAWGR
ncbi:hypothetical protein DSO57_1036840 [Entomophthora muscae]|uniref:Uncharacterized protein n=1 Tax=Entomophthora muscae TaxID=34485 RepID=A0ACC2SNF4_9FUNG|nr:hypothetical protein DSO57_1036840 [Entomophthora muscae]